MNRSSEPVRFRHHGRLSDLDDAALGALLRRPGADRTARVDGADQADRADVVASVAEIIADVRSRGDAALKAMAERFDGVGLIAIEVPRRAWLDALNGLRSDVRGALERAAANILRFHRALVPADVRVEVEPGVIVTRVWTPLARAGVYAPGGTAAYPSSVLMGVVPARAAGVDEVVVCSPPGPDGRPPPEILAACAIAGADRVFSVGGAGAVAAMAFGTETVPAVDVVVGPGNRWVTEAKRQIAGAVLIDAPAGPSEVLVLADDTADPEVVALEMVAQAEHDLDAVCVLVTTSERVAKGSASVMAHLLETAPRAAIARGCLERAGAIVTTDSLDEALDFTDRFAPEHLCILTRDAPALARRVRNAGTTFVGPWASVAFGDYMTGANHVLPTAGGARSFSGLSTHTFLRSFTIQEIDAVGACTLADDVAALAEAEGLPAHAVAARARREQSAREAARRAAHGAADIGVENPGERP